jgi:hypothetical protein
MMAMASHTAKQAKGGLCVSAPGAVVADTKS